MKEERITFRVTPTVKEQLMLNAKKQNMSLSEYVVSCINEKTELEELNDSQGQFLNLFEIAYNKSSSTNFKRQMALLKKIDFNIKVLLKTMDIFMKQLKVPQNKDDVITTFVEHPIITIAEEKVIKEIRKNKKQLEEIEDSES